MAIAEPKAKSEPRRFQCQVCQKEVQSLNPRQKLCGARACTSASSLQYMNANYGRFKDRVLADSHRRRAKFKEQYVEDVRLDVLYARDKAKCGICGKKVPPVGSLPRKRDPRMASIDHVVPLVEGGQHSYANTRLSHYRCNLSRGRRGGGEQLRLIG